MGREAGDMGCDQAGADMRTVQPQTDFCYKEQVLAWLCRVIFILGARGPVGSRLKA